MKAISRPELYPGAKGCWDVVPVPAGFWGNLDSAARLWQSCVAGQSPAHPIARLAALAGMFSLEAGADRTHHIAAIAWMNGARLASSGTPLSALENLAGDHQENAQALLNKVWKVRSTAASGDGALLELARTLRQVLGPNPLRVHGCALYLYGVAAIAGWLAYEGQHLITARAVAGEQLSPCELFLITQLERELNGWAPQASNEALARFFAGTCQPEHPEEALQILRAVEGGLSMARIDPWGPCEFLQDAFHRGHDLPSENRSATYTLLKQAGPRVQEMEELFEKAFGQPLGSANPSQAWDALQDWLPRAHPALVGSQDVGAALLILRHAHEFLFWFGLLSRINSQTTTARWMARARPRNRGSRKAQLPPPDWAAPFIGNLFNPAAASSAGWFNQGSGDAHFGVDSGPGLWLYKIRDMGQGCGCGHVWWRFLFVQTSPDGLITHIRTQVDEVFADGHGQTISDEFLPHDIQSGLKALQAVSAPATASHPGTMKSKPARKERRYRDQRRGFGHT